MSRRSGIYLWALLSFVASELLAAALGIRFTSRTLGILYQYLDPFLGEGIERPIRMLEPESNLLLLGFPVLVGLGLLPLRGGLAGRTALDAYMLVSVLWMTAISNFVEIGENDRMRLEIEPLLVIWPACLLSSLAKRWRARREPLRFSGVVETA